jgi:heme exporter protein CcmD
MSGVVDGGWEFVWMAYGVTAAVLSGYALSVGLRYRAQRVRYLREKHEEGRR